MIIAIIFVAIVRHPFYARILHSTTELFRFYSIKRPHQALGYRIPAEVFTSTPVEATGTGMVEFLTAVPVGDSGTSPSYRPCPVLS